MTLYHYTCKVHMPEIEAAGFLKPGESCILPDGRGPRVVWLTTNPNPAQPWQAVDTVHAAGRPDWDKSEFRFTVHAPAAEHWPRFARRRGIQPWWYRALQASGGNPDEWWVYGNRLYRKDWQRIEHTRTGAVLWVPAPAEVAS